MVFRSRREFSCKDLSDWNLATEIEGYARPSLYCCSQCFISKAQRPLPDDRDFIIVDHAMVSAGAVIQGTRSQCAVEIERIQHTSSVEDRQCFAAKTDSKPPTVHLALASPSYRTVLGRDNV